MMGWEIGRLRRSRALSDEEVRLLVGSLGEGRASTEEDDLREHSADWWPVAIKRGLRGEALPRPQIVIWPASNAEVADVLRTAQQLSVAVTPVGGRSSVVGGAIPNPGGVVLDLRDLNRVPMLDETSLLVTVQAGVGGGDLEAYLNSRGYTLGHYPQSLHRSTVGGWVGWRKWRPPSSISPPAAPTWSPVTICSSTAGGRCSRRGPSRFRGPISGTIQWSANK